jgi:hypothetical protein
MITILRLPTRMRESFMSEARRNLPESGGRLLGESKFRQCIQENAEFY